MNGNDMLPHLGPAFSRRRLLGGFLLVGATVVAAACDGKLPSVPTPLSQVQPKRSEPAPLQPAKPPAAPSALVGASFGRVLSLEGVTVDHDTVRAGDYLRLWLHWQAVAPAPEDLRSIGRVVTTTGRVLASEDDQIGGRRRVLTRWTVGERNIDEMRVLVTANAAPGEYSLIVGVLRPDNQTSVPLTGRPHSGSNWQEDEVLVGTIEIVSA